MSRFNFRQLLLLAFFLVGLASPAQAQAPRAANSVTGHYRLTKSEFRNRLDVQQLSGGRIKFQLVALWVSHNNPDNVHNGEVQGIARLNQRIALYEAEGCKLRIEFNASGARITHLDDAEECGFGANVTAAGAYRKLDSKKPKFDF